MILIVLKSIIFLSRGARRQGRLTDDQNAGYCWVTNLDDVHSYKGSVRVYIPKDTGDSRDERVEKHTAPPGTVLVTVPGDKEFTVDTNGEFPFSLRSRRWPAHQDELEVAVVTKGPNTAWSNGEMMIVRSW